MIDPTDLGQRIQERRKQQGLTQEQLGNDLFVSPQAVSKWENGESLPDIGTFPALCKTLGTSADALLGIDSELGIETLGVKLAQRISDLRDKEERHAALMTALGLLVLTCDTTNQDSIISYQIAASVIQRSIDSGAWRVFSFSNSGVRSKVPISGKSVQFLLSVYCSVIFLFFIPVKKPYSFYWDFHPAQKNRQIS